MQSLRNLDKKNKLLINRGLGSPIYLDILFNIISIIRQMIYSINEWLTVNRFLI